MIFCRAILLCYIVLSSNYGFGKEPNKEIIDTLTDLLPKVSGESKFEILRELYSRTRSVDNKKAYNISKEAIAIAQESNDSLLLIRAYRMNSYALADLAQNEEAIKILQKALEIAQQGKSSVRIKEQIKYILNAIAMAHLEIGNYDKALENNLWSLLIRQKDGNKEEEKIALNNMGLVYFRMGDYQNAISYYSRSLEIKTQFNTRRDRQLILVNLALCYIAIREYEKAISNANEALDECRKDCDNDTKREAFNSLGIAYYETGKLEKGETFILKSLKIARGQNNIPSIASNLIFLGKLNMLKKRYRDAGRNFKEAEEILMNIDLPTLKLELYLTCYQLYLNEKNIHLASDYQLMYIQLRSEVYDRDLMKNLSKVQTKLEEQKNNEAIIVLDKKLEPRRRLISQQRIQFIMIVVFTLLALTLSILFLRVRKKQAQAIDVITDPGDNKHVSK